MNGRNELNRILSDPDFQLLEIALNENSIFHILGIETRETGHSSFLRWLIDPSSEHGMGEKPLKSFLSIACSLLQETEEIDAEAFIDQCDVETLDYSNIRVEKEYKIDSGRIDVIVLLRGERNEDIPILIVEYKINAKETNDQTARYSAWAKKQPQYHKKNALLVYLAPQDNDFQGLSADFAVMDYGVYYDWLMYLENLQKTANASYLLTEFISCLKLEHPEHSETFDDLIKALLDKQAKSIEHIKRLVRGDLDATLSQIVEKHEAAFVRLDIILTNQKTLGYSVFINRIRNALEKAIGNQRWEANRGIGWLQLKNQLLTQKIKETISALSDANEKFDLRLQIAMDRPKTEKASLKVTFFGKVNVFHNDTDRQLGRALANSVRESLTDSDNVRLGAKNNLMVLSIDMRLPGVLDLEEDNETNYAKYEAVINESISKMKNVIPTLDNWVENQAQNVIETWIQEAR